METKPTLMSKAYVVLCHSAGLAGELLVSGQRDLPQGGIAADLWMGRHEHFIKYLENDVWPHLLPHESLELTVRAEPEPWANMPWVKLLPLAHANAWRLLEVRFRVLRELAKQYDSKRLG